MRTPPILYFLEARLPALYIELRNHRIQIADMREHSQPRAVIDQLRV